MMPNAGGCATRRPDRRRIGWLLVVALIGSLPTASCRPDDQRTDSVDFSGAQTRENMSPAFIAQLDSGSAAMRVDQYEAAADHYGRATEIAPEFAAAWFGLYMAHERLGHTEEAEAALERAQDAAPGASLLRETPADRDTTGEGTTSDDEHG